MSTDAYDRKRSPAKTGEPSGNSKRKPANRNRQPVFVIQEHDASTLHYDFRLEVGGVLKSWAVPKGPSSDPSDKRLAIETEDHPLDYADFEGTIPEGEYGAGTVVIWDRGPYRSLSSEKQHSLDAALRDGHAQVELDGEKLSGGYALQRIDADKGHWLLVKMADGSADARRNPVSTERRSVVSGKTRHQVARDVRREHSE